MKNIKHLIVTFFVTMILLFKVASLHALTHHSDDANIHHCEICDISTVVGLTPFLEIEPTGLQEVGYYFPDKKLNIRSQFVVFNNKHLSSYLYTRPPPKLF
jgi:hypothetical protein